VFRTELLGRPADDGAIRFGHRGRVPARQLLEHRDLAIAIDKLDGEVEMLQAFQGLKRHRAGQHIAANHNAVDSFLTNFRDYRFERR
jgi:hypothetical protein